MEVSTHSLLSKCGAPGVEFNDPGASCQDGIPPGAEGHMIGKSLRCFTDAKTALQAAGPFKKQTTPRTAFLTSPYENNRTSVPDTQSCVSSGPPPPP